MNVKIKAIWNVRTVLLRICVLVILLVLSPLADAADMATAEDSEDTCEINLSVINSKNSAKAYRVANKENTSLSRRLHQITLVHLPSKKIQLSKGAITAERTKKSELSPVTGNDYREALEEYLSRLDIPVPEASRVSLPPLHKSFLKKTGPAAASFSSAGLTDECKKAAPFYSRENRIRARSGLKPAVERFSFHFLPQRTDRDVSSMVSMNIEV